MIKIKIFINGEIIEVNHNITLFQLINQLELDIKKIAIEKDLEIINPLDFEKTILTENCKIEIVHFIGGG